MGSTEYHGRCLAFVEDAYELSNGIEIFGGSSARESADIYEAKPSNTPPPRGAFVFYDCWGPIDSVYKNWGHVGLSIGDNQVIHTWDRVRRDHFLSGLDGALLIRKNVGRTITYIFRHICIFRIVQGSGVNGFSKGFE